MQDSIAKEKKWGKKMSGNYDHYGNPVHYGGRGGRRLMEKTILNFYFDYLNPSLNFNYIISGRPLSKQQSRKGAKSFPALLIHTNIQTHLRTRSSSCIENICLLRKCMAARCTASFKIHLPLLRQHVQAPRCFFSTGPPQMICFRFLDYYSQQ